MTVVRVALLLGIGVRAWLWVYPAVGTTETQGVTPAPIREAAYRANNIGVAHLEQYDFDAAIASFKRALEQDTGLAIARLNLGIALFYAGQPDAAKPEIEKARDGLRDRPHPDYVLGLIARSANRTDEALAAFTRAQQLDPTDPGIAINLGQLHLQERRYPDAIAAFRAATTAEPYNATGAYGLATALIRSAAAEEGKPAMERFERLRGSNYSTTFSQTYLEQGRYAEAIASTGAEPELVDTNTPDVTFVDATRSMLPASPGTTTSANGVVALFDLDGDGDLDLADAADALRLYRNDKGRLADISAAAFTTPPTGPISGIVAGDADNDGDVDLLVLRAGGPALYRQESPARFVEAVDAGFPRLQTAPRSAAWIDADHDGDLDVVIAGGGQSAQLLRNNGDGRFADITGAAGISSGETTIAAVPTDFDNRRDIDLLLVRSSGAPALFRNMRDGTFRDVATDVGLTPEGDLLSTAIGDINKDGYPDLFLGRRNQPGALALSDGVGRFTIRAAPEESTGAIAAQFLDYDNDGLLDLVAVTPPGLRALRNLGARWADVTNRAFKPAAQGAALDSASLASGDVDDDGDTDLVLRSQGGLAIWRNEGANRSRSLAVRLAPRVTNRAAVGTKIEVRAGSLRQRIETYAASPAPAPADILFGLGSRPGADVARVLWPSGILQAETASGGAASASLAGKLRIEELDRKPSSCPYLYTWNGDRFEFVTDFLGGGEMGYWMAPGVRNSPDPDEYVRIDGRLLHPRDGRYELRITNELEEAVFLDRAQLVVVAHPRNVEVHPNEGLRSARDAFRLFVVRGAKPPAAVEDEHGHDVLDRVLRVDRRYPDDFRLERIRGYAAAHQLTITLPPANGEGRVLLLTGWTDYAFSGDNVAAHQLGLQMSPPSLQVADENGRWRTVLTEIGFPVGRPQTVAVDLTGLVPDSARRVRIVTTMRIYWDKIEVGSFADGEKVRMTRLEPLASELRWRGFSASTSPNGREPFTFTYEAVTAQSPWKLLPGRYTREGDVRELLAATDDRFVVSRPGDEVALSFDAASVPALPHGWTHTFLLYTDGFSKEMDLNSSSPDQLEPHPFHGMPSYPYDVSLAPFASASHREYLERYNTRIVKRPIPPLELSATK
jgi:tetratricopeptide (TPR) repeat protein